MHAGAPAEERPLAQLRSAGVTLAVMGDVGSACTRGIQATDRAAVFAQPLAVTLNETGGSALPASGISVTFAVTPGASESSRPTSR